jgi:hypothetical protein
MTKNPTVAAFFAPRYVAELQLRDPAGRAARGLQGCSPAGLGRVSRVCAARGAGVS